MKVIVTNMDVARKVAFYQAIMSLAEQCELIVVQDDNILYAGDAEPKDNVAKYYLSMARGLKPDKPLKIRYFPREPGAVFNAAADKKLTGNATGRMREFTARQPVRNHFPTRPKF